MIQAIDDLGIGLYTPSEAAFYARVPTSTMTRWIFGAGDNEPVISRERKDESGEKIVTFLDFVQAMSIRAIRLQHKIPLQKIRSAVEMAKDAYGVRYPFAMPHKTFLISDGKNAGHGEIVIKLQNDTLVQISGKKKGNLVLEEIAELFMKDLSFNELGLASKYVAWKFDSITVEMDPEFHFGEPVVTSCAYSARALWEAVVSEGGMESAARAYGVSLQDVEAAYRYFDHLRSTAV